MIYFLKRLSDWEVIGVADHTNDHHSDGLVLITFKRQSFQKFCISAPLPSNIEQHLCREQQHHHLPHSNRHHLPIDGQPTTVFTPGTCICIKDQCGVNFYHHDHVLSPNPIVDHDHGAEEREEL